MLKKMVFVSGMMISLIGITFEEAYAQASVSPGQRIRATMANGGQVVGVVTSVSQSESITLMAEDRGDRVRGLFDSDTGIPITIPAEDIEFLEITIGNQSGVRKGAAYGAVAGAGFGLLVGLAFDWGLALPVAIAWYGGLGAGAGAIYGYIFMSPPIWVPVEGWMPPPSPGSVGLGPALESNFASPTSPSVSRARGMSTEFHIPISGLLSLFGAG